MIYDLLKIEEVKTPLFIFAKNKSSTMIDISVSIVESDISYATIEEAINTSNIDYVDLGYLPARNLIARNSRRGMGNTEFHLDSKNYIAYIGPSLYDRPILKHNNRFYTHPQIKNYILQFNKDLT